ncbi:MAG: hypothetical protein EA398_13350 [Deltaproteobacteria bacterium]|nr:MAG: hypothetical protein EA398_13350 [Deltaproteobacteria bacterium]
MSGKRKRAARGRGRDLCRDELARWAMQMAPEHLFAMLTTDASCVDEAVPGEAVRLDTQAATNPWRVDGLYLRTVGPQAELWLVEMQTRAVRREPRRTAAVLRAALRQIAPAVDEEVPLQVMLVEVRTGQSARRNRAANAVRNAAGEPLEDCDAVAPIDFVVNNRLLFAGPWTQVLLAHAPAWPLWAFGRSVTADRILDLVATIHPAERYAGSIAALLRAIGRVRYPEDERFRRVPEEEEETMARALAQLEEDGRITSEERKARVRQYLARLDEQEQRHVSRGREQGLAEGRERGRAEGREEGREEGRRETLLTLLGSIDPEQAEELGARDDLDTLEEAVKRLLVKKPISG